MRFELELSMDVLRRTPGVFLSLLDNVDRGWSRATEGPETFSPFDVVGHLIDGEETDWIPRARIILAGGDNPAFEPYDRFRHWERNAQRPLASLLQEFAALRASNLEVLGSWHLTEADLDRKGTHPSLGPVTLRQLLAAWVVHDLGHIAQAVRVMAKQYREEIGPWEPYLPVVTDRPDPRSSGGSRPRGACTDLSKVPEVTLGFWILKILATTLGETGGDAVSMSMNLGYLVGSAIFMVVFVAAVVVQIRAERFHPVTYWATIIASTTVGTTLADFATRSVGIGYAGGSIILFALLLCSFVFWYRTLGSVDIRTVGSPQSESLYWFTIMISQTLGTALGDWTADTGELGYLGAATIFSGLLLLVVAAYAFTKTSRTFLFWAAFVLTRPLGAVVGDYLDKPAAQGGLELSRYSATAALILLIVIGISVFPQRAAQRVH